MPCDVKYTDIKSLNSLWACYSFECNKRECINSGMEYWNGGLASSLEIMRLGYISIM